MSHPSLQANTLRVLRDLHARESMRLGWYRQLMGHRNRLRILRERKAVHQAFLLDLLRKREASPVWYARLFYYMGHAFGLFCALLPERWVIGIERTLENWLLIRYEKYRRMLELDGNLRTMIEALQNRRMNHNEPGADVRHLLEAFIQEEQHLLGAKI
jgi:demethoxyubiquinone hydroxylase (CLK1/Coq7/Cat5 family)